MSELLHATAISLAGRAVLIRGSSGTGKSDLALRCLADNVAPFSLAHPTLVADDQVIANRSGPDVYLSAPETLAGLLEIRGLGIVRLPHVSTARLTLVVDLVTPDMVERMPDRTLTVDILGVSISQINLYPFEASAPLKLLLALNGSDNLQ